MSRGPHTCRAGAGVGARRGRGRRGWRWGWRWRVSGGSMPRWSAPPHCAATHKATPPPRAARVAWAARAVAVAWRTWAASSYQCPCARRQRSTRWASDGLRSAEPRLRPCAPCIFPLAYYIPSPYYTPLRCYTPYHDAPPYHATCLHPATFPYQVDAAGRGGMGGRTSSSSTSSSSEGEHVAAQGHEAVGVGGGAGQLHGVGGGGARGATPQVARQQRGLRLTSAPAERGRP